MADITQLVASQNVDEQAALLEPDRQILQQSRAQFGRSPAEFQREVRRIFGYSAPWHVLMVPTCFSFVGGVEGYRMKTDTE